MGAINRCEVAKLGLLRDPGYRSAICDVIRSKFDFEISKNDPKYTDPVAETKAVLPKYGWKAK